VARHDGRTARLRRTSRTRPPARANLSRGSWGKFPCTRGRVHCGRPCHVFVRTTGQNTPVPFRPSLYGINVGQCTWSCPLLTEGISPEVECALAVGGFSRAKNGRNGASAIRPSTPVPLNGDRGGTVDLRTKQNRSFGAIHRLIPQKTGTAHPPACVQPIFSRIKGPFGPSLLLSAWTENTGKAPSSRGGKICCGGSSAFCLRPCLPRISAPFFVDPGPLGRVRADCGAPVPRARLNAQGAHRGRSGQDR